MKIWIVRSDEDRQVDGDTRLRVNVVPQIGSTVCLADGEFLLVHDVIHHLYGEHQIDVHVKRNNAMV